MESAARAASLSIIIPAFPRFSQSSVCLFGIRICHTVSILRSKPSRFVPIVFGLPRQIQFAPAVTACLAVWTAFTWIIFLHVLSTSLHTAYRSRYKPPHDGIIRSLQTYTISPCSECSPRRILHILCVSQSPFSTS